MKHHLLTFTLLFAFCFIGCDIENPFTSEEPTDAETDTQASDEATDAKLPTVNVVFPTMECPPPNHDWELLATLERDPLNPYKFYVPDGKVAHLPDLTDTLNGAYAEGKDFIFVIRNIDWRVNKSIPIQHYLLQVAPPVNTTPPEVIGKGIPWEEYRWQFQSKGWYKEKREYNTTGIDTRFTGLSVIFDLTPDPSKKPKRFFWNPPRFFVSYDGIRSGHFFITEGTQLHIYINK